MSTTYAPSNDTGTCFSKAFLAFLATVSIFALLPLMQMIPPFWITGDPSHKIDTAQDNPPVVIEPIPEKPKEKEKPKQPELEKPLEKIDLRQLEILINTGPGDGRNYLNIGNPTALFVPQGFDDLYEIEDLHKKPKALFQIEPVFPYNLRNQRIEGWVILEWIITDRGRVTSVKAISYSHREFQQPAIDSVLKSKWQPGEIDKKPVNTRVRQRIVFNP